MRKTAKNAPEFIPEEKIYFGEKFPATNGISARAAQGDCERVAHRFAQAMQRKNRDAVSRAIPQLSRLRTAYHPPHGGCV
jgi:hypothetical protein